jgi:hypothetical protein
MRRAGVEVAPGAETGLAAGEGSPAAGDCADEFGELAKSNASPPATTSG